MHKQLLKISVFFHFHHSRTNRLCWYVGRAHQHCPPHNGESHKNHDAWKKERILSLAGGRTRSTGRYPERERTFSQKHSVKEQIKQWYVWLISGQQLLLFYSITKLLTQLKLSFVFTTKFPGISVYFMYNLTSDSKSIKLLYLSQNLVLDLTPTVVREVSPLQLFFNITQSSVVINIHIWLSCSNFPWSS